VSIYISVSQQQKFSAHLALAASQIMWRAAGIKRLRGPQVADPWYKQNLLIMLEEWKTLDTRNNFLTADPSEDEGMDH
jgi:hypothetical protein